MMKTFLSLFLGGALFAGAHAQGGVADAQTDGTLGFVEQDRSGFRRLSGPSLPTRDEANALLEMYEDDDYPIIVNGSPRYRITENIDRKLVSLGVINPDVDLFLSAPKERAMNWLLENLDVDESSQLVLLDVSWKFPKEYYFYHTPGEVHADAVRVRAWHPFRVDAQFRYTLNGREQLKTIPQWVTENVLRETYANAFE